MHAAAAATQPAAAHSNQLDVTPAMSAPELRRGLVVLLILTCEWKVSVSTISRPDTSSAVPTQYQLLHDIGLYCRLASTELNPFASSSTDASALGGAEIAS